MRDIYKDEVTHQVLITETSELLKFLGNKQLSTPYSTADRPKH